MWPGKLRTRRGVTAASALLLTLLLLYLTVAVSEAGPGLAEAMVAPVSWLELAMLNLSLGLRSPAPGLLGTDRDTPSPIRLPSIAET